MILPPSLREIRGYAFYDCHKLKEIAVPNECIKISANAFFFCAELTDIVCKLKARVRVNVYECFLFFFFCKFSFWIKLA